MAASWATPSQPRRSSAAGCAGAGALGVPVSVITIPPGFLAWDAGHVVTEGEVPAHQDSLGEWLVSRHVLLPVPWPGGYDRAVEASGASSCVAAGIRSRALKYSSPSMLMRGRIRPSQRGRYQLALPRLAMRAGTSRQRTTVASRITATARPMPNCLTVGSPLSTKLPNTNTMIVAAAVITRPLVTSPETTARLASSPASACSLIWLTRNTS